MARHGRHVIVSYLSNLGMHIAKKIQKYRAEVIKAHYFKNLRLPIVEQIPKIPLQISIIFLKSSYELVINLS